jgi:hypothetical protein
LYEEILIGGPEKDRVEMKWKESHMVFPVAAIGSSEFSLPFILHVIVIGG